MTTARFSRLPAALLAVAGASVLAGPARAALVITVPTLAAAVAPGSTGVFDVDLTNTGPTASPALGSFAFQISVAGASGVTFTGVSTGTTTAPYIFAGQSLFGPDIRTSANGPSASASDAFAVIGSGVTLSPGMTVGLGHVSYSVAANAPAGLVPITLSAFPATSLANGSGNNVPFTGVNGSLTVTSLATVPEPSPVAAFALAALGLGALRLRARRRRA